MTAFTESEIEIFSLDELKDLGFSYIPGPSIAPDGETVQGFRVGELSSPYGGPEKRATYGDVVLKHTLDVIPSLFFYNAFCVISDGLEAKAGTISSAYHQYHAVNKAVESTRLAATEKGNRKAGVIWHTQGSGKSLSMVFYTGKLIHNLDNPTVVVITDRNDLDQQLFDTFAASVSLLGQAPVQAETREHLKSLLKVASGGIVFTTIQKFFPGTSTGSVRTGSAYDRLSERRNIIVIADEAHRTQYGFQAKLIDTKDAAGKMNGKRLAYGFAKYLRDAVPNATFIGFTGTPAESADINTPAVFGNYIDVYDIAQAVEDGATVKIYYESRLAKISLTEDGRKLIEEFDREMTDMQAIARVNRVFMDKPGGLVVDYIGIGNALKEALAFYSSSGGKGDPAETQAKALELLLEKMEVVGQMFHGFGYLRFFSAGTSERLSIILQAEEFILSRQQGKDRFIKESTALSQLFALAVPHEDALALTDEIAFFQSVRARLLKFEGDGDSSDKRNYESAIRQIVNQAVESTGVVDIFDAAGIKKPDISLLSEEFLQDVKEMKHKNLGLELLKKILNDEIKVRLTFNITEGKNLLDMLEASIKKYQNNLLTTAEIIEELLAIARNIRTLDGLAEKLKLTKDEFAFYTALEINDSAVKVLGDETLKSIAREIAEKVRNNATIDWAMKESARAKLMVIVKRTLNKYGYPPDKQQKAVDTVLKQAEVLADYWVAQ